MYVLALNSRIPKVTLGNLCIRVDACFHPTFSDRNLGALFEVLCVGLNIMNLKLFDHYCMMLLTRHYDHRLFDETVCDALIANGDVK